MGISDIASLKKFCSQYIIILLATPSRSRMIVTVTVHNERESFRFFVSVSLCSENAYYAGTLTTIRV